VFVDLREEEIVDGLFLGVIDIDVDIPNSKAAYCEVGRENVKTGHVDLIEVGLA
jgi:hypothetical protein